MDRTVDHWVCTWCGERLAKRDPRRRPGHLECGIKAAVEHNRQMHAKSGPEYDRWRAGMIAHAAKLAEPAP